MKISKKCNNLLDFFIKNDHINYVAQNLKTKKIIKTIYGNILEAYKYINNLKQIKN